VNACLANAHIPPRTSYRAQSLHLAADEVIERLVAARNQRYPIIRERPLGRGKRDPWRP
jgi:hypothetical protein